MCTTRDLLEAHRCAPLETLYVALSGVVEQLVAETKADAIKAERERVACLQANAGGGDVVMGNMLADPLALHAPPKPPDPGVGANEGVVSSAASAAPNGRGGVQNSLAG